MRVAMPWPAILLLLSRHSRGLSPQQARRTPHAGYHGQGQLNFFEGWYNRITLPENDQSFAFIYAIFDPGRRTERPNPTFRRRPQPPRRRSQAERR